MYQMHLSKYQLTQQQNPVVSGFELGFRIFGNVEVLGQTSPILG